MTAIELLFVTGGINGLDCCGGLNIFTLYLYVIFYICLKSHNNLLYIYYIMSKSIYNNSGCGSGCSSKSLVNSNQVGNAATAGASVTQFISSQNISTPAASNPSTGVSSTVDTLTVSNNLTVLGTSNLNKIQTNSVVVSGGGLTLTNNTITSTSNIELRPFNPTPCDGFVLIENNLRVNGCFTDLCTTDIYIKDPVPSLNYCNDGTLPVDDNNDIGFEMKYIIPGDLSKTLNTAFMGFDRTRFPTKGPRFVFWYDTDIISPPDQNYRRKIGATKANGVEADILYTYLITNPDDTNAPATIPGGFAKTDITIDVNNALNILNLKETHDIGQWEKHTVGSVNATQAGFRVEDATNTSCNFIELAQAGGQPGFQANATGKGLYLWHNDKVDIQACAGTVYIGPQIGGGPFGSGNDVNFINSVNINNPNKLRTNFITEISSNLLISTSASHNIKLDSAGIIESVSAGFQNVISLCPSPPIWDAGIWLHTNLAHDILLQSSEDIGIESTSNMFICTVGGNMNLSAGGAGNISGSTNNGNITFDATGFDKLVEVNPGIRFTSPGTSNPGITNPERTIWYDNNGIFFKKNFKTNYIPDGAPNYPFVVSASENALTNNKLAMYRDNSGWAIEKTNMDVDVSGNGLTIPGVLNATNVNNNVCANGLIFSAPGVGGNYCYKDNTFTPVFINDKRILYLNSDGFGNGTIEIVDPPINGTGLNFVGGNFVWTSGTTDLQGAYNNSSPATIEVNNANGPVTIDYVAGYSNNQTIFRVTDDAGNPYFNVIKRGGGGGNLPTIQIRPRSGGANNTALSIQDFGGTDKITFTPNSSNKIATFNGDIKVTGTIDPDAIVFTGQTNNSGINPPNPGPGNGSIYVRRTLDDALVGLPNTYPTFVQTGISGVKDRPMVFYDDSSFLNNGGYSLINNAGGTIPVFTNDYGNGVITSTIAVSTSGSGAILSNIQQLVTGTISTGVITIGNSNHVINSATTPEVIVAAPPAANSDITLPQASSVPGRKYTIINESIGASEDIDILLVGGSTLVNASSSPLAARVENGKTGVYVSSTAAANTWYRIV